MFFIPKSMRRLLPAALMIAAATNATLAQDGLHDRIHDRIHNRDNTGRPKVSPACDPLFGYHGTEWRRWPGAAPDPFCAPAPLFSQAPPIMTPFDPNMRRWPTFNGGVQMMTPLPQAGVQEALPQSESNVPMVPTPDQIGGQPPAGAAPMPEATENPTVPEALPVPGLPNPNPEPQGSLGASAAESAAALSPDAPLSAPTPTSTAGPGFGPTPTSSDLPTESKSRSIPEVLPEPSQSGIMIQPNPIGGTPQQQAMQDFAMQQAAIQHQILQRQAMEQVIMQQEIAMRNMLMERAALQGSVVLDPIMAAPGTQPQPNVSPQGSAPAAMRPATTTQNMHPSAQHQHSTLLEQLAQSAPVPQSGMPQQPQAMPRISPQRTPERAAQPTTSPLPGLLTPRHFTVPASSGQPVPARPIRLSTPSTPQNGYTTQTETAAPLITKASSMQPVGGYAVHAATIQNRSIAGLRMPVKNESETKKPRAIPNQRIQ